jgi:hypothetical protein
VIRKGTLDDEEAVVALALEAVGPHASGLHLAPHRVRETIGRILNDYRNFQCVVEHEGRVVGCMAAAVEPLFYAERCHATVLMIYCKVPGLGIGMVRRFARWLKENPSVRQASIVFEESVDPRLPLLFERLGFTLRCSAVYQKA